MLVNFALRLVALITFSIGLCASVSAQLYSAPTVGNVQNLFQPQTINSRTQSLAAQRQVAGYGAVRSPFWNPSFGAARIGLGASTTTRGSKPFSSYSSAPTVSPYLNLFRTDLAGGGNFNYSTLVEPQLQQQQVNQQLQRAAVQQNRRLTSIAAQSDYNPEGAKDQYPTGHQTVFNYMGHYYSMPQARQKPGQR